MDLQLQKGIKSYSHENWGLQKGTPGIISGGSCRARMEPGHQHERHMLNLLNSALAKFLYGVYQGCITPGH